MTKYHAQRTEVDGIVFASKAEAKRYCDLRLLEHAGEIRKLELQPRYPIEVNGIKVCTYVADFRYQQRVGRAWVSITEDVKGMATPVFKLKAKLLWAVHRVKVQVVK